MKNDRIDYFDTMRAILCLFVVFIHSVGSKIVANPNIWDAVSHNGLLILAIIMTISRVAVSGFLMISGALLIQNVKNTSIEYLFKHRIKKFAEVLIAWSVIVYLIKGLVTDDGIGIKDFITKFTEINISSPYWYLYGYIIILSVLPLLSSLAQNSKSYMWLFVCVGILTGYIPTLLRELFPNHPLKMIVISISPLFVPFVLGSLLNQINISKFYRIGLYVVGLACLIITFSLAKEMFKGSSYDAHWWKDSNILILGEAVAFFVFMRHSSLAKKLSQTAIIRNISKCSLGIYMVHELVIFLYTHFRPLDTSGITVTGIALLFFVPAIVSFIIISIVSKVPIFNKIV